MCMSCRRIQPVSPQEPLVKQAGKCGRSADFGEVVMQRSSFLRTWRCVRRRWRQEHPPVALSVVTVGGGCGDFGSSVSSRLQNRWTVGGGEGWDYPARIPASTCASTSRYLACRCPGPLPCPASLSDSTSSTTQQVRAADRLSGSWTERLQVPSILPHLFTRPVPGSSSMDKRAACAMFPKERQHEV